jgi:hypothetical protein
MAASVYPMHPQDDSRQSDLIDYITGNDPNLTFIQTIGDGGQRQVHIVLPPRNTTLKK